MRSFNLEEYLANPTRKVVTRDGKNIRIICTDCHDDYPIIALLSEKDGSESIFQYTKYGAIFNDQLDGFDLFFADDPLPEFKPYDRVLTRRHSSLPWKANLFSNFKKVGGNTIAVCLNGDYLLNDIISFDENKVGKIEQL